MGIEAMAHCRYVGTMHPKAIALTRAHLRQVAVPDVVFHFPQGQAGFLPLFIKQTEIDPGGVLRKEGKIGAGSIPGGPQGMGLTGPDLYVHHHRASTPE